MRFCLGEIVENHRNGTMTHPPPIFNKLTVELNNFSPEEPAKPTGTVLGTVLQ